MSESQWRSSRKEIISLREYRPTTTTRRLGYSHPKSNIRMYEVWRKMKRNVWNNGEKEETQQRQSLCVQLIPSRSVAKQKIVVRAKEVNENAINQVFRLLHERFTVAFRSVGIQNTKTSLIFVCEKKKSVLLCNLCMYRVLHTTHIRPRWSQLWVISSWVVTKINIIFYLNKQINQNAHKNSQFTHTDAHIIENAFPRRMPQTRSIRSATTEHALTEWFSRAELANRWHIHTLATNPLEVTVCICCGRDCCVLRKTNGEKYNASKLLT